MLQKISENMSNEMNSISGGLGLPPGMKLPFLIMSALGDLIELFSKLPNLGPRSARRIVLHLLKNKEKIIPKVISLLNDLKSSLTFCENCGNVDIASPCSICNSTKRKSEKICVVEDIGDLWAIEKSKAFDGHYHVLGESCQQLMV